jgi:hypothetical protein
MAVARWTVWLEATRPDGTTERVEIAALERDLSSAGLHSYLSQDQVQQLGPDELGLRLGEAKDRLQELCAPSSDTTIGLPLARLIRCGLALSRA